MAGAYKCLMEPGPALSYFALATRLRVLNAHSLIADARPVAPALLSYIASESVRKHQAGLRSFRSMRRIEARRKNASALRLRFSQSLASLRQRLSHARVRSTIQRLGSTTNPLV